MNFNGKLTLMDVHECSDMFHLTFIKNVAMETSTIYNFCMMKFLKTLKNKGKERTGVQLSFVLRIISVSQVATMLVSHFNCCLPAEQILSLRIEGRDISRAERSY